MNEIAKRHVTSRVINHLGRLGGFDEAARELRDYVAAAGSSNRPFCVVLYDDCGDCQFTEGDEVGMLSGKWFCGPSPGVDSNRKELV